MNKTARALCGGLAAIAMTSTALPARAASSGLTESGQWGLDQVDQRTATLDNTYSYTRSGLGVTIYVVDTGVAQVSELSGRESLGTNPVGDGNTGDCNGHGTPMASLAAGSRYGVAKLAKVVNVRVQGCDYAGTTANYVAGLNWIVQHHRANPGVPAVANLSWDEAPNDQIEAAVQAVIDSGVTVVAAAGNTDERSGGACAQTPARMASVITVGAVKRTQAAPEFWSGSNAGSCIDLLAPGYNITATTNSGGSALGWGTSQATALASGAAALVLEAHPTWSPKQVHDALVSDATIGLVQGVPSGTPNRLLYTRGAAMDASPAAPATSAPVAVPAATATASLSGTAKVGRTLTLTAQDVTPSTATLAYSWYRVEATGLSKSAVQTATYPLGRYDLGKQVRGCVTVSAAGRTSTTTCATSAATAAGTLVAPTPTIAGTRKVGYTLTANPGTWGPAPVSLSYQWYRVSSTGTRYAISGATARTRVVTSADRNFSLTVRVVGRKTGWSTATRWAANTSRIA